MDNNNQLYFVGFRTVEATKQDVLDNVPESWHAIVDKLIDDLFEAGWDGELAQVKEKFGSLRFYINHGNDEIFRLIDEAEAATEAVCIVCGEPATTTSAGWYTHRCEEHGDT